MLTFFSRLIGAGHTKYIKYIKLYYQGAEIKLARMAFDDLKSYNNGESEGQPWQIDGSSRECD
jgi:hypothetical protein